MNEIRDIHEPFIAWLKKLAIPYHRNRPDKRTTAIKGDPDFLVMWMGHGVYIECKVPGNKLSPDQVKRIDYIRRAGNKVVVAYSLEDCIDAVKNILCVGQNVETPETDTSGADRQEKANARSNTESAPLPGPARPASPNLFIAHVLGQERVCRGSGVAGSDFDIVRVATAQDLMELR